MGAWSSGRIPTPSESIRIDSMEFSCSSAQLCQQTTFMYFFDDLKVAHFFVWMSCKMVFVDLGLSVCVAGLVTGSPGGTVP